jgi:eukaryotic-like serine/threonine-protein kinase
MGDDSAVMIPEGYTVLGVLDDGPSGPVTVARPPQGGPPVAIVTVSSPGDDPLFDRLTRLMSLRHPGVAPLLDWVEAEDGLTLVTELVDAVPLRGLLGVTGLLSVEAALVVLHDSLQVIAAVNDAGLPRGDHRPETVALTRRGEVRLLEVGVTTAASPPYLAPEVWNGGPASPASDVYAATAVLVECLSGSPPYGGPEVGEALRDAHLTDPVPVERVPEPLRDLVRHGLAKDPRSRPGEARLVVSELITAAAAYGSGWQRRGRQQLAAAVRPLEFLFPPQRLVAPPPAAGPGAAMVTPPWWRRRTLAAAAAAAGLVLLAVGGGLALRHGGSPPATGRGGNAPGSQSDRAPLVIPGASPTPTPEPTPEPSPSPAASSSPTSLPATPAPTTPPIAPPIPSLLPRPNPGVLMATGVRDLSFDTCTPGSGGYVCPFTVTFDWNDPTGAGGSFTWQIAGTVVTCGNPGTSGSFSFPETTQVPAEAPGAHPSERVSGSLTFTAAPVPTSAGSHSSAAVSLDGGSPSSAPAPFGGSGCRSSRSSSSSSPAASPSGSPSPTA